MKRLIISLVLLSFAVFLGAQQPGYYDDVSCIDTLPAAIKIDRDCRETPKKFSAFLTN